MVTRTIRIAAVALALFAGCSRGAAAQSSGSPSGFLAVTGGATIDTESGGALGVEGGFDFAAPVSIVVEGGRLFKISSPNLTAGANRIAGALGVTATAVDRVNYFDAGLRFRLPALGATRPYVTAGGGVASVSTETTFGATSTAVALQLGSDLSGTTTKPFVMAGAGLSWTVDHLLVEVSYRYGRIFPKTDTIPNDTAINTHRVQASLGVRF